MATTLARPPDIRSRSRRTSAWYRGCCERMDADRAANIVADRRRAVRIHREHEASIEPEIAQRERSADELERLGFAALAADQRQCAANLRAAVPQIQKYREHAEAQLRLAARHLARRLPSQTTTMSRPAQRPRQRSAHRHAATPATVGGDSGDDDPAEPPGDRRRLSSPPSPSAIRDPGGSL